MTTLFLTGRLLLEIASVGFGVTLGFAVKHWLERGERPEGSSCRPADVRLASLAWDSA